MTKIEAVIQNSKLEAVKSALHEIGVEGMTVLEVRGHGRQKGHTEVYRGREYSVDLIPKTKLEMVLADGLVDKAAPAEELFESLPQPLAALVIVEPGFAATDTGQMRCTRSGQDIGQARFKSNEEVPGRETW